MGITAVSEIALNDSTMVGENSVGVSVNWSCTVFTECVNKSFIRSSDQPTVDFKTSKNHSCMLSKIPSKIAIHQLSLVQIISSDQHRLFQVHHLFFLQFSAVLCFSLNPLE